MVDEMEQPGDDGIAAARAEVAVVERRWTVVYVVLFLLGISLFALVWLRLTAGERACKGWMAGGEPRLVAIMIEMDRGYGGNVAICTDAEALRYFEECYRGSELSVLQRRDLAKAWANFRNRCSVEFRFENGAVYRPAEPCSLTTEGLTVCLSGNSRQVIGFQEPMPEAWRGFVVELLGHGAFDGK